MRLPIFNFDTFPQWGISDAISGIQQGAQGVLSGAQTLGKGGGQQQWGQNFQDGTTQILNGTANMYTDGLASHLNVDGSVSAKDPTNPGAPAAGAYDGMPTIPDYTPGYDPATMSMLPGYLQQQQANSSGLNTMRSIATSGGASPWASLAQDENQANLNAQLDRGAQSVAGQKDSADASMAMQGGLSEGARERNSETANKNFASMAQGGNQTASLNNLNILKTDEQNKLGMLGGLTNAEQQQVQGYEQARGTDVNRQIQENANRMNYNMNKYGIQGGIWGAGKQADATMASAPQGINFLGMRVG